MSGHSKWSTIKHKKALNDARRAGAFNKLIKNVTIAARDGGDQDSNFRLRLAIDQAKSANVPNDNIDRAIKRGTGEDKEGEVMKEHVLEAYGPGQAAILIKIITDNKNRSLMEVKSILKDNGGKMAEGGGVSWQFKPAGILTVKAGADQEEEAVEMALIESGAEDYRKKGSKYEVFTGPRELQAVKENLEKNNFSIVAAEFGYVPNNPVAIPEEALPEYEQLRQALLDSDEVAAVFDNLA